MGTRRRFIVYDTHTRAGLYSMHWTVDGGRKVAPNFRSVYVTTLQGFIREVEHWDALENLAVNQFFVRGKASAGGVFYRSNRK